MRRTLTDLSQLSQALFKTAPRTDAVKPAPSKAKPRDEGEEVLAYFSRPAADAKAARKASAGVPPAGGAVADALARDAAALRAQLRDSEAARREAEATCCVLERARAKSAIALKAAEEEVERLKGECGRLRGASRKAAPAASGAADAKAEPSVASAAERPVRGVLAPPAALAETFPGEVREMVLSALSEARDAARQSSRERRAAILDAVLATNRPSGELERRRAELKQTLKDCGYCTDPKALERLGFKLVSGRTHWKLEYGGIRMPIAKTPSDHRASLNMATDLANRCF